MNVKCEKCDKEALPDGGGITLAEITIATENAEWYLCLDCQADEHIWDWINGMEQSLFAGGDESGEDDCFDANGSVMSGIL